MSNHCPYCQKKISISKVFCSKECKDNYFQMVAIQIPKPFIKRIFVFCDKQQREKEITEFASRHGWKESLIRNKINKLKDEYGF
ncbi:hypothetical protein CPU12_09015 [Malaciobacter molluscorum LMG 25693]|uniref:DUF2116 family Zn-ribbon domain-containing protein n=1 Tax=Malaciobacter molluscorum LMG 25693 TaxID=870501 RepID=A0A2G1DH09_9BACT|nr:DUF2116 family Zn-ribbon domain-containing protein [Malaciobacter molluscorum]AXX92290.1 hypothetical protein AMOL_1314 [Malaciobacter molluscorum LMG 25693]PHO17724.1 hypothetical protein CPU12_09015 [Malaciobacter molluscorum LMG 25693]